MTCNIGGVKIGKIIGELIGMGLGWLILVWIFPKLPFVSPEYLLWLPVGTKALVQSGVLKIFSHLAMVPFAVKILRILSLFPSLYSTYMLLIIFPFEFERIGMDYMNGIFRFVLYVAIFGIVVGIIVESVRLFVPPPSEKKKKKKSKRRS